MTQFFYTEDQFTDEFIGKWRLQQLDKYNSKKAGTGTICINVRSIVDHTQETIQLIGHVPNYADPFPMDGNSGIKSEITDEIRGYDNKKIEALFMYCHKLTPEDVTNKRVFVEKLDNTEIYSLTVSAEFGDSVMNMNHEFTFPLVYYIKQKKAISALMGFRVTIPLTKFNHYIRKRTQRFIEYCGAKPIQQGAVDSPPKKRQRKTS